ncbi:TrkA family potassium uptake protein [Helicobacter sp. MIT 14-3879]|uniref:potassium channel family protein n=1 Tax=Helicobacter sp. MIT 14-3879 TaxID=2040649 RepID=UPI000E1EE01C|nr:TrkA family potassium uptake protein [Helicobacter sp. MIT 14-3879]RDU65143.1 TrkA family potassium uptake protein [Helicobacter sp. MIT 14-3879]
MKKHTFGVIGLGNFGYYVAHDLILEGKNVIIADKNEEAFKELKNLNENSFILDSTDKNALQEAGFCDIDIVIVSIGENIESSILTLMALKELNIKTIIAKAINKTHGKILSKLGVNKIIYPERDMAKKLINEIIKYHEFEVIDIEDSLKVAKVLASEFLSGSSIEKIIKESNTKVLAIKHNGNWIENPPLNTTCYQGDTLIIFGKNELIDKFAH